MAQKTWTRKRRQKRQREESDRHLQRQEARKARQLKQGSDELDLEESDAHLDESLARSRRSKSSEDEALGEALDGLVLRYHRSSFEVEAGKQRFDCRTRSTTRSPHPDSTLVAVGDRVLIQPTPEEGEAVIVEVLPRRNKLSRSSKLHEDIEQVIVANVDQLVIISSLAEPYPKPGLIDRYLVTAAVNGFEPLICFNKADLDPDNVYQELLDLYLDLGYACFRTSADSGEGLDRLRKALAGKSSVFSGQSGVGKSSLLNALNPELGLKVGEISAYNSKGRHTTTNSSLISFNFGGHVVDTPGIKELSLWNVDAGNLQQGFPEILELAEQCRFRNCSHRHEPDCEVLKALDEGRLHPLRYQNYESILESL